MNNKEERRCAQCKKLLIDEKIPLCRRCRLNDRNYGLTATGTLISLVGSAVGLDKLINKGGNGGRA